MARPADPHARAALVAAARAEFVRKGLKGARIEDLTAACGLSKGAFYLHFTSKEALFGELVAGFKEATERLSAERMEGLERFIAEHGPLEARDVAERTERYERLVALHAQGDVRTLELLWEWRDVVAVLMSGSQGTLFESLVWGMVEHEVERVGADFHRMQRTGACRPDVPPEIFGSLIIGTHMLLAQRMGRMERKPDLEAWARSLHRLIREGSLPQETFSRTRSTSRSKP
jgi:AcrR family transcriptional regulator